jgi:hypothetical protein
MLCFRILPVSFARADYSSPANGSCTLPSILAIKSIRRSNFQEHAASSRYSPNALLKRDLSLWRQSFQVSWTILDNSRQSIRNCTTCLSGRGTQILTGNESGGFFVPHWLGSWKHGNRCSGEEAVVRMIWTRSVEIIFTISGRRVGWCMCTTQSMPESARYKWVSLL